MSGRYQDFSYISQSNAYYTVKSFAGEVLYIPKPHAKETTKAKNYNFHVNYLKLAAIGLPLGGLLTLILCPIIVWNNVALIRKEQLTKDDRVQAENAIIFSIIFFLLGIGFFSLFIMHLVL